MGVGGWGCGVWGVVGGGHGGRKQFLAAPSPPHPGDGLRDGRGRGGVWGSPGQRRRPRQCGDAAMRAARPRRGAPRAASLSRSLLEMPVRDRLRRAADVGYGLRCRGEASARSSLSRPRRVGSALGKESCRAMWGGKESNSFLGCEYMREIASSVERWGKRRRERRKSRWEGGEGSEHLLLAIIESNRKVKLERGKSAHGYGISITVSLNSVLVVMSIT